MSVQISEAKQLIASQVPLEEKISRAVLTTLFGTTAIPFDRHGVYTAWKVTVM